VTVRPGTSEPGGDTRAGAPDGPLHDPERAIWDRFVASQEPGSYLQLSAWAEVKAVNGWSSARIDVPATADTAEASAVSAPAATPMPRIGAQVLVRRPGPVPWGFGYAPRGPVGSPEASGLGAFTDALRSELPRAAGRVSHVRIDPEIEVGGAHDVDGSYRAALDAAGWRPAAPIQPAATRIIDLSADEDALWSALRKKWRQYVNKARSGGVTVVDGDADRLSEFHAIYRETADRAGFLIRTERAYRDIWDAYRPSGGARLLFAQMPDGEPVATLFLVRCGARVVEPYGGMTAAGADSRANYLLKWEAIRSSREQGASSYDLWGLATGGIAHFKTGFGGREVRYIGAYDLTLNALGRAVYEAAVRGRVAWVRRRHGLRGGGSASAYDGNGADGAVTSGGDPT
jgi:lipid II:glycine glycyltransferase (peptidoglycan interpeptide bridge formation enzyme)